MEEYIKENKLLHALKARTIRELVESANKLQVQREDVITILQENSQYVLLYYYKGV